MKAAKKSANEAIYQLKVTLKGSRPAIRRRFQVPGAISLHRLHRIIQVIMGWTNSHLYRFEIEGVDFSEPDTEGDLYELEMKNSKKSKLNKVVPLEKAKFIYVYDFGDNWEHEVVVENIFPVESGVSYPICIAGKRACPPEDCGGIWGYADLLKIIRNPNHEEYESMMEWLGGRFNPEAFDMVKINKALKAVR